MEHSSHSAIDYAGSASQRARRTYTNSLHRKSKRRHSYYNKTLRSHSTLLRSLETEDPEELIQNDDFVDAPHEIQAACLKRTKTSLHEKKSIIDTFIGWFLDTELYYGYYHNGVISVVDTVQYDMRYAYICVMAAYYIITVIVLSVGLSQSYKHHYIEESGGNQNFCIVRVLSGWDYKITTRLACTIQQSRLYQELQEYLVELHSNNDKQSINQYGILSDLAMPLCITAINSFTPFVFSLVDYIEKYKNPRVSLILSMLSFCDCLHDELIQDCIVIGVCMDPTWKRLPAKKKLILKTATDIAESDKSAESHLNEKKAEDTGRCFIHMQNSETRKKYNILCVIIEGDLNPLLGKRASEQIENYVKAWKAEMCWENFIGMQIYALVIFDFIFMLLVTLFSELFYRLMVQCCLKRAGHPEFNIARNTLNLMYSQILVCIAPSKSCGPYQSYNNTYQILEELLDNWNASDEQQVIKSIIRFILSDVFQIYLLIVLAIAAYYINVIATAHEETVKTLHRQIILEGKDKKFLLNIIKNSLAQQNGGQQGTLPSHHSQTSNNNRTTGGAKKDSNIKQTAIVDNTQENHYVDAVSSITDTPSQPKSDSQTLDDLVSQDEAQSATANRAQIVEITNPVFRSESVNKLPDLPYHLPYASLCHD
ncbi:hypothetical protein LSH36_3g11007 [Paralvinella palmiformis]|uniref:TMC domain-containing protein n=1 Tax=Paralvinella palmiformis TaxID=53620 RepID=A0AAD9KFP0_9ANNE|nr:hypothetical protein LSH36_3g11007 [Paralvinella palmiformis]